VIRRHWLLAAAALAAGPVRAQARYPSRPVTLMVPFAPGGIADITARTVAQAMGPSLGQTIVVDNRPSAGSIVAGQAVAQAAPDGYTLLLMSNGNAVSAGLFKKLPFDVVKDFAPISTLGFFELVICADRESRFKSLRELVAYGKVNRGQLTLATIAVGSTQNLAAELFKSRTGVDAIVVPYKGSSAVLTALRAGEVDAGFEILGTTLPQITGGALRALAVTGQRRNASLPDVPTAIEQGVTGYDVESWNALAAPAGTPPAVIERLRRAAQDALARPEVSRRLVELGVRPQGGTPAQLRDLLAGEITRWRGVIEAARIERQ
jgi:tripartite-type tricarboxylate transporter receptor subunit TctC